MKKNTKSKNKSIWILPVMIVCICLGIFGISATTTMDYENNQMTYQTGDTQELPTPEWDKSNEVNPNKEIFSLISARSNTLYDMGGAFTARVYTLCINGIDCFPVKIDSENNKIELTTNDLFYGFIIDGNESAVFSNELKEKWYNDYYEILSSDPYVIEFDTDSYNNKELFPTFWISMDDISNVKKDFAGWWTKDGTTTGDWGEQITSIKATDMQNMDVYAKWDKTFTINFNNNGHGTAPESQSVREGYKVSQPSDLSEDGWIFNGWFVDKECIIDYDFDTEIVGNKTLYAGWESAIEYLSLGGKVFLDNGDNGATYTFYDVDKNEITYTDTDLSSLNSAVYYSVEGTPSKDRFYVVASDSSKSDYNSDYGINLGTSKFWGYYNIKTGATTNTIGSGKTNTQTILANEDTSTYNLANGGSKQSIWEWLNDVNTNEYGGYSDWFIGSEAEYDALNSFGKTGSLFTSKLLWSSVEPGSARAYGWNYRDSIWDSYFKRSNNSVLAFRAF